MKSEEAGHERIIWVQKFHLPEPKIHQPRASGWVLIIPLVHAIYWSEINNFVFSVRHQWYGERTVHVSNVSFSNSTVARET